MLIYAAIEDAIIARVKAASDSNDLGYRILEIGSYGGEFDDDHFFTQYRKLPAVWVTVGGEKPKRISAKKYECAPNIAVMVGSRNVRGERHARRGSVGEPGSYQMLEDVRDLLVGQDFGLGIDRLALGPVRTLFNSKLGNEARSVLSMEFSTTYTFSVRDPDAEGPDLTSIGLKYYLKPGDDVEDASDDVTLVAP